MGARATTALLFGAIIGLFVAVGGVIGYFILGSWLGGLVIALGLSLAMNLISYFFCDRFVLWANRAKVVSDSEAPRLAKIVHELAPQFGLVEPRIALIPTDTPNAFATGRNPRHAVVAATVGILRMLDDRELRGVLAHELAHVKDRDILVMTFAATIAGAISYLAQMAIFSSLFSGGNGRGNQNLFLAIGAGITAAIAAILLQLAISRSRESRADEVGARTIGDPNSLADALQKLDTANIQHPMPFGSPASSSLFIVNPFRGNSLSRLFSTHPPIQERIAKLRAMASDHRYSPPIRSPQYRTGGRSFSTSTE